MLDWETTHTGEVDFDLHYLLTKQGTALGGADTATINTLVTPSGADAMQIDDDLTAASIDISSVAAGDIIFFTLIRDGSSDANTGVVYPHGVTIQHVLWTAGDHV